MSNEMMKREMQEAVQAFEEVSQPEVQITETAQQGIRWEVRETGAFLICLEEALSVTL